jgi:hypothetical protein
MVAKISHCKKKTMVVETKKFDQLQLLQNILWGKELNIEAHSTLKKSLFAVSKKQSACLHGK